MVTNRGETRAGVWIGAGCLAVGLLVGLAAGRAIWRPAESWRYVSGPQGTVYRIRVDSGETWWTIPGRAWVRVVDPRASPEPPLPAGFTLENN
jgi:hypothetical protein